MNKWLVISLFACLNFEACWCMEEKWTPSKSRFPKLSVSQQQVVTPMRPYHLVFGTHQRLPESQDIMLERKAGTKHFEEITTSVQSGLKKTASLLDYLQKQEQRQRKGITVPIESYLRQAKQLYSVVDEWKDVLVKINKILATIEHHRKSRQDFARGRWK